jgi:diaminopimelate decarboxylase
VSVARDIIARNHAVSADHLIVGGVRVDRLADEFGTPLFVYAGEVIDAAWHRLRAALPARFAIHYSIKANPHPALIRRLLTLGAGLEIASAGELSLALHAGATADRVLFAGPGKGDVDLELAIKHGIGEIHVESLTEIDRVALIGGRLGVKVPVGLRVNPSNEAQGGAMRMGGSAAAFGVDEEIVELAVARILGQRPLDLRGLHLFTGTQILDHRTLLRQYDKGLELARRVAALGGRALATLDFGGGLGIPYFDNDAPLDIAQLGEGIAALLEKHAAAGMMPARFVVEPGRYLVGEAGVYIARVVDVKTSRNKRFAVLDGGMNHHLAASGNLGQVIKRNFPVVVANRLSAARDTVVDLVGPLCTPLDVLGRDVRVSAIDVGDLVAVLQSGAYGRTASPLGFLSHPAPAEVIIDAGRPRLIRRRAQLEDLLSDVVDV